MWWGGGGRGDLREKEMRRERDEESEPEGEGQWWWWRTLDPTSSALLHCRHAKRNALGSRPLDPTTTPLSPE